MYNMSSNKKKTKLSLASTNSVVSPQMSQMWPAMQLFNPWSQMMAMGSNPNLSLCPSSSKSKGSPDVKRKPWESSSESSDDSDDFVAAPAKKKRKLKSAPLEGEKKRGPGRPKKEEAAAKQAKAAADLKIVQKYPSAAGKDEIAFFKFQECKNCRLWKGRISIQPCGHSLYCFSCMDSLKKESEKLGRPSKCLSQNCFELVTSWFKAFNISP